MIYLPKRRDDLYYWISGLAILGLLYFWDILGTIVKVIVYFIAVFIGFLFGCRSVLCTKRKYDLNLKEYYSNPVLHRMLMEHFQEAELKEEPRKQTLISRNVDGVLREIIDYIIRDYVSWWYKTLGSNEEKVYRILRNEIWVSLANIKERMKKMDDVKLFTSDIVLRIHHHFQKIKDATHGCSSEREPFELSSFLDGPDTEKEYLRRVTDFMLALVLPSKYAHCQPLRHLLREILACLVLYPAVEYICDPDTINQKLVAYLQWQQEEMVKHSQPYTYAKNYEEFIQIINRSTNVESLKCMRYCIVTEIMQATTITNLKRAKGIDVDKEFNPQTSAKGDLLQARNLKRYVNQLQYAKTICERQIKSLGGPDYSSSSSSDQSSNNPEETSSIPGKRVLSFSVIMESEHCRKYFLAHLKNREQKSLLGFWEMVQEMKSANKATKHELGNEIIKTYVNNPSSGVKLPKNILKGMEAFMMADKGPDAFFQAQEEVYKIMEERYYPTFIVSSNYHKMLASADVQGISFVSAEENSTDKEAEEELNLSLAESLANATYSKYPSHANSLLQQLKSKLKAKKLALHTFWSSSTDSKMVQALEKEVMELETETNELECFIVRTSDWMKSLGQWKASISSLKVRENERVIDVTILVYQDSEPGDSCVTWKVQRTVGDFHTLLQRLVMAAAWLKKFDLPSPNKPWFRVFDQENHLKKVEEQLQAFLKAILEDEDLRTSEAVYQFLVTMPDVLQNSLPQNKKAPKFSLIQFFKSSQGSAQEDSSDDELLFLDEVDSKDDKKDSIAEPLYALIGEIFELKGVFSILRRTLITFVQISFGKTINRQLRETVSWIVSEPMLLYYLQLFRDSIWPGGQLASQLPIRIQIQKEETRNLAKTEMLNNVPEVLSNFVGQQNARTGMSKIFEAHQDARLNKQLFYDILEAFIYEFAPELRPD